jgi:TATA-binding protein-associated factor Taf7
MPMSDVRRPVRRAAILSALLLAALPLCSMAQQDHSSSKPHAASMHEHMQEGMQKHLDHLAARLEIRASQQEAWNTFATAVRGLAPATLPERPADDLDAAARARLAADRAAEHSRKLAVLADATAKLQQGLDAPQKQVLNEVARNLGHHWRAHAGMHGDMHSEHCHESMHEGHGHGHEDH